MLPTKFQFIWLRGVSEEKIKMWKVNGRRMPSDGKSSLCLWQGGLKMWDFDDFENNVPSSRKRQHRVIGNVNINQLALCWDWFQDFVY